MPTRSSSSEYQPSPPVTRLNQGKFHAGVTIKTTASSAGVRNNMCVAPATNGSREHGLAASSPTAATKGMSIRPTIR